MTTHEVEEDTRRVRALERYRALQDLPRRDLEALVEVAARVCQVPMATINLITDQEQVQVAAVGFEPGVCSREDSMCARVLTHGGPVVVPDARVDDRWRDNPFVTGEIGHVRFYATCPLVTPQGIPIGTLCVFAEEPRTLTPAQEDSLQTLADRVVDLLELGLQTRELAATLGHVERMRAELERSNEQLSAFAGQVSHDLRNPLASVALSLDLLEVEVAGQAVEPTVLDHLAAARRESRRLQLLVEELLAVARRG